MPLTTTLSAIRAQSPCEDGWRKLLSYLGKTRADDEPLAFKTIFESNGLSDALWCLCTLPPEMDAAVRLLVCDMAGLALAYVPEGEERPRLAIETARRYARGEATRAELAASRVAADAAANAAAEAAAWAAGAAATAAAAAAEDAAGAAAWEAAEDARAATWEAAEDAWEAGEAAEDAARQEQERIFRAWLASV